MDNLKSGIRTTEFWLSFLAVALGAFLNSGILVNTHPAVQVAGMIAVILGSLGYGAGRVAVKRATAQGDTNPDAIQNRPPGGPQAPGAIHPE